MGGGADNTVFRQSENDVDPWFYLCDNHMFYPLCRDFISRTGCVIISSLMFLYFSELRSKTLKLTVLNGHIKLTD